jgi:hypothetical protein
MFIHPDLVLAQAHNRQRELVAEADRHRLLKAARRNRRGATGRNAQAGGGATAVSPAARGRPGSTRGSRDARVAAAR